jgi:trehalose transport system substrate-binding protein
MFCKILHLILLTIISLAGWTGCNPRDHAVRNLHVSMDLTKQEKEILTRDIFPAFEKAHNVRIFLENISRDKLMPRLKSKTKSNNKKKKPCPDVFSEEDPYLRRFSGVNANFLETLDNNPSLNTKAIHAGLIDPGILEGKLKFQPFRTDIMVYFYNSDALNKLNLTPPQTWEELFKATADFGQNRILLGGYDHHLAVYQVYQFIKQANGNPYNFNDKGSLDAFIFLETLGGRMLCGVGINYPGFNIWTIQSLIDEKAYWSILWASDLIHIKNSPANQFIKIYGEMRGPANNTNIMRAFYLAIPKNGNNKNLAKKFIAFMQDSTTQRRLAQKLVWFPVREDDFDQIYGEDKDYFDVARDAFKHAEMIKPINWWPLYTRYAQFSFRQIVIEKQAIEDIIKILDHNEKFLNEERDYYVAD